MFECIPVFTSYLAHVMYPANFTFPNSTQGEYLELLVKK